MVIELFDDIHNHVGLLQVRKPVSGVNSAIRNFKRMASLGARGGRNMLIMNFSDTRSILIKFVEQNLGKGALSALGDGEGAWNRVGKDWVGIAEVICSN